MPDYYEDTYYNSYRRMKDRIPYRLKEMGITRKNWNMDAIGLFMDGELVLCVIQRPDRDPLQLAYVPNTPVSAIFDDLEMIEENGGEKTRLIPPESPESQEGEEWKDGQGI